MRSRRALVGGTAVVVLLAAAAWLALDGGDDGGAVRVSGDDADARRVEPLVAVDDAAPTVLDVGAPESSPASATRTVRVKVLWPEAARDLVDDYTLLLTDFGWNGGEGHNVPVPVDAPVVLSRPPGERWRCRLMTAVTQLGWAEVDAADELLVDARGLPTFHGRVTGPDGPVPGIEVVAWGRSGSRKHPVARVTTDAAGRFRFGPLPDDWLLRLEVREGSGLALCTTGPLVATPPPLGEAIELVVARAGSVALRGRVVDAGGGPVRYTTVKIDGVDVPPVDERGRFAYRVPGRWPVVITVETFDGVGWAVVRDETEAADVTIMLLPSASLRGTLHWSDGEPVDQVSLRLSNAADGADVAWRDDIPVFRGRFLARRVPPGPVRVEASSSRLRYSGWHEPGVPAEIVVPRSDEFTLSVRPVVQPAPESLRVLVSSVGRAEDVALADGRYEVHALVPGGEAVTVHAAHGVASAVELASGTAGELDGLVVDAPTPRARRLEVSVSRASGEVLAGAGVRMTWPVAGPEAQLAESRAGVHAFDGFAGLAQADADADGRASFEVPPDVPVDVLVTRIHHRPERRRLDPSTERVDVVLRPQTPLAITARSGATDAPRDG